MADKTKLDIEDFVGKTIDDTDLQSLISGGHITFPEKEVTSTSTISQGSTDSCEDKNSDDGANKRNRDNLGDMIDNVKENEGLIKTLEDMRDDMLAGMNIPPASQSIGQAARIINGNEDDNITKDTFDKAEAILDIYFPYIAPGYVPQLTPLVGDTRIINHLENCHDITKAAFEGLEFAEAGASPEDINAAVEKTTAEAIADTEQSFKDQLAATMLYLINKLFWNIIWCRM